MDKKYEVFYNLRKNSWERGRGGAMLLENNHPQAGDGNSALIIIFL